jgi:hypothetical protein
MKAHLVKGSVFTVVFSFSRAVLGGRGGHGCLDNRLFAFHPCGFVLSSGFSSSCGFVMNHVFAVLSGMSLC